jgi:hypothetical protein
MCAPPTSTHPLPGMCWKGGADALMLVFFVHEVEYPPYHEMPCYLVMDCSRRLRLRIRIVSGNSL